MGSPAPDLFTWANQVHAGRDLVAVRNGDGSVTLKPGKITLEGAVRDAAKILACSPRQVCRLIESGDIRAWKVRSTAPNCKYTVDLVSVREHKRKCQASSAEV